MNRGYGTGVLLVAALCGAIVGFGGWLGARTNFFPALNDFWPLFFQASQLDPNDLGTFKNGFFPPGYALFLRALGGDAVLARAFWANVLFTCATTIGTFAFVRRFATTNAALLAAALTAAHPTIFSLGLTTGPDAGCILLSAGGFFLMVAGAQAERSSRSLFLCVAAGACFGLSALLRYHGLVFGFAAVASGLLMFRRSSLLAAAWGPAAVVGLFAALSLLPGLSPQLARAQAFVVWEGIYPINWYHVPMDVPPSVAAVIRSNPEAFWRTYSAFSRSMLWVLAAPALGAIALDVPRRRIARTALLLIVPYLAVVNIGTSPRGVGPVVPIAMACTALLLDGLAVRWFTGVARRTAFAAAVAAALILVGARWMDANRAFVQASIAGYEWRRSVELALRSHGVKSPLQVYGDAGFHFVTVKGPAWHAYFPHANGGWPRFDLYKLDRLLPELSTCSLDAFVRDCRRRGITHVVLSGTAGFLLPALGDLYYGRLADGGMELVEDVAGMKIFRVSR